MSIMGLDVGTSGCKATIINADGSCLGQASQEYALQSPQPGWQELDPNDIWAAVRQVIRQAVAMAAAAPAADPVRAIAVSSFGESVVAIDRDGQVLHNCLLYIDSRGRDEAAGLEASLGSDRVLAIAGTTIQPMYSLSKILWLRKHRPDVDCRIWKYLLIADFILYRLGARPHTDYSLAARTMAFDITAKQWSGEILAAAGIDPARFADPVQAGTPVGEIDPSIAAALGLPRQATLVAGGHDQPCAALGAGANRAGLAVDGLGTTECITPVYDRPILSAAMAGSGYACVPHVLRDLYVTYAFTFTGGSILKWYRNNFGAAWQAEATRLGVNAYDLMIDRAMAGPDPSPVLLLPHFAGAATPYMDTSAQGAILGLTIDTTARDILKAVLEGITFEIMINLERLSAAGIQIDELRSVGGLARSETFLQLKADMMGKPITSLEYAEAGTIGVAILAGTAVGIFSSIEDGIASLVRPRRTFYPREAIHRRYQERFAIYKRIYPAVRDIIC